ncbi:DUF4142 domain-containing protein [Streptomyces sp. NPDC046985]|uniref:DUF4142 domain-containing protein n=1 Tax=Streptomyces sp. NPDC046985 TaxID=3155377 RepID=UPI0033E62D4D
MRRYTLPIVLAAAALTGLSAPQTFAASPSASRQDQSFLVQAHQGNLAEIAAGKDAQAHATTACVKKAGETWVRDHTKLDASVQKLAAATGTKLPSKPSAADREQFAAVQAKAGTAAYDKAWLKLGDAGHRKTLDAVDKEIRDGKNSKVVAGARAARPVVVMHLNMIRGGVCR